MGTWAAGSFGNDSAGDWVIDLLENPSYLFIQETLSAAIEDPGDSMLCENAIAAAEVLCIVHGIVPGDYEEVSHNLAPAIEKLKQQSMPEGIKNLAVKSVKTIAKESELKELWEDDEEWTSHIEALALRLKA